MIPVVYVFAYFLAALAVSFVLPAIVAIGLGEGTLGLDFLVSAALWLFVAGAMMLSLRGRERRLRPAQRYLLAFMLWLLLPVVGAVPLMMTVEGVWICRRLFRSCFRPDDDWCLGASGSRGPAAQRRPLAGDDAVVRGRIDPVGGRARSGAVRCGRVAGDPFENDPKHGGLPERRRLILLVRDVFPLYLGATAITFLLLASTELEAFRSTVPGFQRGFDGRGSPPRSVTIAEYVPTFGIFVLIVAMLYGATNVLWQRDLIQLRRSRKMSHRESLWTIGLCLGLGLLAGLAFFPRGRAGGGRGNSRRSFHRDVADHHQRFLKSETRVSRFFRSRSWRSCWQSARQVSRRRGGIKLFPDRLHARAGTSRAQPAGLSAWYSSLAAWGGSPMTFRS